MSKKERWITVHMSAEVFDLLNGFAKLQGKTIQAHALSILKASANNSDIDREAEHQQEITDLQLRVKMLEGENARLKQGWRQRLKEWLLK